MKEMETGFLTGFLHIKEMVYDTQRLKLYQRYSECVSHNIDVYDDRTDRLLVKASSGIVGIVTIVGIFVKVGIVRMVDSWESWVSLDSLG